MNTFRSLTSNVATTFSLALALLVSVPSLRAQTGSVELGFNPNVISPPTQVAIAVQPDGKILIGGLFTAVNGESRNGIARLNPDGTLESTTTFDAGSGANSWVNCIVVQADGKILLGGLFTTVNGQPRKGIARLNPDGTLESTTTFDPGSGMGGFGYVWSVAVQPDGKILVGGNFTSVNGQPRNGIARLNPDGSVEGTNTFNPVTGANAEVVSVAVQLDGKILLGGDFTIIGQPRTQFARLNSNGTLENTVTLSPDAGGYASVQTLSVQPDGKILLGGYFTAVNGQPRNHIARLNSDCSVEDTATFNLGTGLENSSGPVYSPISIALQVDGKILVAGDFTSVNGQPRKGIVRLNPDGTLEGTTSFNAGTGANSEVYSVVLQADGKILLGGAFTSIDGHPRQHIARLENDSATQSLLIPSRARVQWTRGGAAPEIEQVTFELSTDGGANWSQLGPGARIPVGWERTGLSLPASGLIRARGRPAGSYHNGSSGLVEQVQAFPSVPATNGLVAYYPFNGNANDASGNGNNGTVHGAALATDRLGNPNGAYSFDGVSDFISIPDNPLLALSTNFTVSAWYYQNNVVPNPGYSVRIVDKGTAGVPDGYVLSAGDMSDRRTSFMGDTGLISPGHFDVARWHHITVTSTASVSRMYMDGIEVTNGPGQHIPTNTLPLLIGAPHVGCGGGCGIREFFNGRIEEVRIYNRELSAGEVAVLADCLNPVISAVSTNLVPGSNSLQNFTIYGANFNANCTVTLRDLTTGGIYSNRTKISQTATSITLNPNFGTSAHTWSVEVINPGAISSGQYQFSVTALANLVSLTVSGPSSLAAGGQANFTATASFSNGTSLDVSTQAAWSVIGGANGTSMTGRNLYAGSGSVSTAQVRASWSHDTGTRSASANVAVGGGINVRLSRPIPVFVSRSGNTLSYQLQTLAITNGATGAVTVAWTWNGATIAGQSGASLNTIVSGAAGTGRLAVTVTDSMGQSGSSEIQITLNKPSIANEPIPKIVADDGFPGLLYSTDGTSAYSPTAAKKANGFIVIVHGLDDQVQPPASPQVNPPGDEVPAGWMARMGQAIETQLASSGVPNILLYDWRKGANPSAWLGLDQLHDFLVEARQEASTYTKGVLGAATIPFDAEVITAQWAAKIIAVRHYGRNQGHVLEEWMVSKILQERSTRRAPYISSVTAPVGSS